MDKKNTILLTVIAVATLLVAVVGATFAYFSVTTSSEGYSATTVTGQTGKIPTITVTNPNKNLTLNVSATEMAQENAKEYYAKSGTECASQASCNIPTTKTYHQILSVETKEGDTDTVYSCTGTIDVEASGGMTELSDQLQTGDVSIELKNLTGDDGTELIDLVSLTSTENKTSKSLKFEINGNNTVNVEAFVMLENSSSAEQNYLAGKDLNVTITAKNVQCAVKTAG